MAASDNPADMVFHEVQDQDGKWHIFDRFLTEHYFPDGVYIPLPPPIVIGGYEFRITKFMILEVIAAVIILLIFVPLARRIRTGELPKGTFWNFFESILVFIRDEIARPNLDNPHPDDYGHDGHAHGHAKGDIDFAEPDHSMPREAHAGHVPIQKGDGLVVHEGDRFVPFLWTLFMFILVTNLLGLIPFMGSATASIWVTGALAVVAFLMFHLVPTAARGNPISYLASIFPHIDLGPGIVAKFAGLGLSTMIFLIELLGTVIKSFVLAVRLFANLIAGHLVLGFILVFIYSVGKLESEPYGLWAGVTFASVLGVVALSLLELFVAFLQAYVFTFLTALFLGMNLYPEH